MKTKVRFIAVGDKIALKALLTATYRGTMQRECFVSFPFLTTDMNILEPIL